ncbi:serine hydrolase domain-containing protein [Paenibacillus lemnae]|uniref:Beta-lactamase family protein n=1 Tax=Paenibacillus lemnae TaxID=1330551 RepID=A0A848M635_PAELE|nr:serine hydrolase domain-containing protein [Paenibacillus lemnae]NMO95562.1 beta-lactamase family protein [Paenibacillus lemnae]
MKEIISLFDEYYKEHDFSGAALIQTGNETLFSRAYGLAHQGFKIPNELDTRFDTASVTKLFTATAVLQLVEKGKLHLDDRITDLIDLAGTQIPEDVTLSHLLTHTSGIADDADEEEGENYEDLFKEKPNYSIRECIDFLPQFAYKEPKFKAGTDVSYNNCAYVLLGLAIEKASGESYRDYVTQNVFQACGMENTGFFAKDQGDAPVAEGYDAVYGDGGEIQWRKNIYAYPPVGTADGGAFTTVGDLDRFIRALADGRLLSSESTAEILKSQTTLEEEVEQGTMRNGYGFHFIYDHDGKLITMFKDGINAGVGAMLAYYPEQDTTIAILVNQTCNIWELHRKAEQILSLSK